jgi:hypothetical protein
MFFTRLAPRTKSKGAPIGGLLFSKNLCFFTHVAPRTKSKGAPNRRSLSLQKLSLFTRVVPRTKSKGLPIGGPLFSKNLCFLHALHRIQKAKMAPDQRSTHLLLLSARASPRTKSKGLHRYVLQIYYFINQVFKSFSTQRVSSSPLYHPNNKPSDPDQAVQYTSHIRLLSIYKK